MLKPIFNLFILLEYRRGCEPCVFHCISQTSVSSVRCFVDRLVLTILDVDSAQLAVKDAFCIPVSTELIRLEIGLRG